MPSSVNDRHLGLDSPGSSVFDLPTQQYQTRGATPVVKLEDGARFVGPNAHIPVGGEDITSFVVISGGSGGNAICPAFRNASYVLPVSDDGGSSSEIIRVIGGPSIGMTAHRYTRNCT